MVDLFENGELKISKRQFIVDTGKEQVVMEGYEHKSVATKFLMKKRRGLLVTKDKEKVERMFKELPAEILIKGKQLNKTYKINWEKVGITEFEGARFVFTLEEI